VFISIPEKVKNRKLARIKNPNPITQLCCSRNTNPRKKRVIPKKMEGPSSVLLILLSIIKM